MTALSGKRHLAEMTWAEAREAFVRTKLAIVPLGSIEQHGPHLPLGTDWYIADHLARMVADRTDAVVTPTIPVGFAEYHTDFPGSLSVPTPVLHDYIMGIVRHLLRYGATHFLFINGHGGNLTALNDAMFELRNMGVPSATSMWWEVSGLLNQDWALRGHGDVVETSLALAIRPQDVHLDAARLPANAPLTARIGIADSRNCTFEGGVVKMFLRVADVSASGDFIEYGHSTGADYSTPPGDATAENGAAIFEAVASYLARFVEEFLKVSLRPIADR
ncbi:MAG: creatininase family protein [Bacillota bacterium]|nr:creatininase family protein [Bacillota bacterium]